MNTPSTTNEPTRPSAVDHSHWFTEEVHSHATELRAYVRGSFPTVCDVDDVVQESFLRVWKARAAHPIRSAKAFLFTVARHVAINLVHRERGSPTIAVGDLNTLPVLDDRPAVAEALHRSEKRQLLVEALAQLPPRCREIIILRKLKGRSQREVAEALGLSERTIEEQVSRGLKRCRAYMNKRGIVSFYE